ncbi:hypothetical protein HPU94_07140 [Kosakonia sacchari]|nr:hypothetical protein [Kosakonia sacchari]
MMVVSIEVPAGDLGIFTLAEDSYDVAPLFHLFSNSSCMTAGDYAEMLTIKQTPIQVICTNLARMSAFVFMIIY